MQQQSNSTPTPLRPWRAPVVRSTGSAGSGAVLLCTSGTPFTCEGGGCCDVDPDCQTICNGG
jgi:hypothetical protein